MRDVQKSLKEKINAEHRACEEAAASAVHHAISAGEMLQEVKENLPHGAFSPWLQQNFGGSQRTAQTYMRLYRGQDALGAKTQRAADMSIREALKEIEPPSEEEKLSEKEKLSEAQILWNAIALLIEDSPKTFLFEEEIPLAIKRLWRGPEGEADVKLLRDYRAALDSVPENEIDTDFDYLNGIALVGWRTKRAIEAWVAAVVMESGDRGLQVRRLRYEAGVAELEANPEAWEVYWHVTVKEPLRAGGE